VCTASCAACASVAAQIDVGVECRGFKFEKGFRFRCRFIYRNAHHRAFNKSLSFPFYVHFSVFRFALSFVNKAGWRPRTPSPDDTEKDPEDYVLVPSTSAELKTLPFAQHRDRPTSNRTWAFQLIVSPFVVHRTFSPIYLWAYENRTYW